MDPSNEIFIPWKQFENVFVSHFDDGGDQHAKRLVSKMTPPSEFLAFLKPKLNEFAIHDFEAKQDTQFKSCLDNLTNDQIVIVIDFLRTILSRSRMKFNFNISSTSKSLYLCIWHFSLTQNGMKLMHHLGSWPNIIFMWTMTKHMIIYFCNTASNSIANFLHYKVFCYMLNTLSFLMVALHNSNAQKLYFLLRVIHPWLGGMIWLWDVPWNGTILILVMVN